MGVLLAVLVIWLAFGVLGFAVHALWYVAVVIALVWLAGFAFRAAEGEGGTSHRWYRW